MAKELARGIKEGAIPIISDVEGFVAYYVVYAPDDTVTAISIFNDYAGAEESNRRALAWIEQSLTPLPADNSMDSMIEGSSFWGLLTRVEIGHIRIGSSCG